MPGPEATIESAAAQPEALQPGPRPAPSPRARGPAVDRSHMIHDAYPPSSTPRASPEGQTGAEQMRWPARWPRSSLLVSRPALHRLHGGPDQSRWLVINGAEHHRHLHESRSARPRYFIAAPLLILTGLSHASYHAGTAMIAHVSGNRVGKGMSFFMTGGELGRAFAAPDSDAVQISGGDTGLWPPSRAPVLAILADLGARRSRSAARSASRRPCWARAAPTRHPARLPRPSVPGHRQPLVSTPAPQSRGG